MTNESFTFSLAYKTPLFAIESERTEYRKGLNSDSIIGNLKNYQKINSYFILNFDLIIIFFDNYLLLKIAVFYFYRDKISNPPSTKNFEKKEGEGESTKKKRPDLFAYLINSCFLLLKLPNIS